MIASKKLNKPYKVILKYEPSGIIPHCAAGLCHNQRFNFLLSYIPVFLSWVKLV